MPLRKRKVRDMNNTAAAQTITTHDIEAGYEHDGWLGFGYLGERRHARAALVSCEWTIDNIEEADEMAVKIANEKGWSSARFFDWVNSKDGRWYADIMLGGELSLADVEMAHKYVR